MQIDALHVRAAVALAGCAGFLVTVPLAGARAVPPIVRAGLVLMLMPLAAPHVSVIGPMPVLGVVAAALAAAVGGATLGLSAAIVAGAAASAGSLLDSAVAASPIAGGNLSGQSAGPFATLLPLGFAMALFSSGGFAWLVVGCIGQLEQVGAVLHHGTTLAIVGRQAYAAAISLALPLLCANGLSSLIAGVAARAAPKVNGMLLAPAVGSLLTLLMALAAVPAIVLQLGQMAHLVARVAHA